ncbi:hypothetical protein Sru01_09010 [Sphaerisporangium rufum]|uniref:Histidine kinase/HSP90-like ATPase domain-containing protein n=1 Tax=Sphaerisporangium rufum TaxID=1381558 RepID=A0A919QXI8_9ACTN|nr:ATP-binding protein [Sphaerisporangium rufum]GII75919.1 hypothetical protein Sru01_09010 [Sphaerisporangium rufum]
MTTVGTLLGRVDLLADDGSTKLARAYVRSLLCRNGHRDVDDIELMVSEVFANAVRHSESGRVRDGVVTVRVYDDGETVRIEVTDAGSPNDFPAVQAPIDPLSEGGRGLWLVQELSSSWGWRQNPKGRTIWFEVRAQDS